MNSWHYSCTTLAYVGNYVVNMCTLLHAHNAQRSTILTVLYLLTDPAADHLALGMPSLGDQDYRQASTSTLLLCEFLGDLSSSSCLQTGSLLRLVTVHSRSACHHFLRLGYSTQSHAHRFMWMLEI